MEIKGFMTELERHNCGNVTVVVSYWTNHKGTRFAPKMRFLVGDEEVSLNALKHGQALMIQKVFNTLCENWPQAEPAEQSSKPKAKPAPEQKVQVLRPAKNAAKKKPSKKAERSPPSDDLSRQAADAIAKLMAERAGA